MRISPGGVVLGAVGLGIGLAAVLALREATLSTHQAVAPGSRIDVVVDASTHGGEEGQTPGEMVEAVFLACRLEVSSDLAGPIRPLGDGQFRATLVPSLDETNRRQLRGCLEDWVVDHVRLDVLQMAEPRTAG